jgi:SAM-dependent methyltransferase
VSWEIFEKRAGGYEEWYGTPHGCRVDRSERALLVWLLGWFPDARRVLEIGCGTGHFTRWLAGRGYAVIGLDRSIAMLREAQAHTKGGALLLADAHQLPLSDRAVDVSVFVATLEFLESPHHALKESVRVARRGLILIVLNRWSLGAISRRWGWQSRGSLRSEARDLSRTSLRKEVARAAGQRLLDLHWRSTLLPRPFDSLIARVPFGDALGVAIELAATRTGELTEDSP